MWELIEDDSDEKIKVWKRIHESGLFEFKGQGPVKANIGEVISHLSDPHRLLEWVDSSVKADLIEKSYSLEDKMDASKLQSLHHIQYMEYFVPFPFENRDVVLKGSIDYYNDKASGAMGAKFTAKSIEWKDLPKKDGLTRISLLSNITDMRIIDENNVMVEFKVLVNPAGKIPAWLVNLTSRRLPYNTIQKIRKMVKEGNYDKRRKKFVDDFTKIVLVKKEVK